MKFINGKTDYNEFRDHSKDNKAYLARMEVIEAAREAARNGKIQEYQYVQLVQQVVVSEMTGKLEGYYSVSTSVLMNPICQARARIPGSICAKCYAASTAARYSALTQSLETNTFIMTEFLIPEMAWATLVWPTTNGDARVESFGDVRNVIQARNYLRIIKTHPWLNFGVWTKNAGIWAAAFKLEGGKPENMKFIISSMHINQPDDIPENVRKYADHRFTVYTAEFAEEHNITINCGGRKCATCRNCYKCNTAFDIAELLK